MRSPWLHRFVVFAACCTFLLVIAGGLVTSTDSGLAVPDWPLSYGMVMPPMIGGIFYEHGHRMVATFVGMLTTVLAFWIWRAETRRWMKVLGWTALGAVILQGVLGGITVLYLLPTPVSVAHATLAQSFLSLMVCLALFTSDGWINQPPATERVSQSTNGLLLASTAAIFLQLIIGGWMRHSAAGLSISSFPMTYDNWLPPTNADGLALLNAARFDIDLTPVTLSQVWIHFAHRVWAIVVVGIVVTTVIHILRRYRTESRLREPAIVMVLLVVMQFLLGALTVWTGKGVQIATAHVATGALLMATSVYTTVRFFGIYAPAALRTASPIQPRTVPS